jgi:hypothetical protein
VAILIDRWVNYSRFPSNHDLQLFSKPLLSESISDELCASELDEELRATESKGEAGW